MFNYYIKQIAALFSLIRFPIIKEWGWVFAVCFFSYVAHLNASTYRHHQIQLLTKRIDDLQALKSYAQFQHGDFQSKINSLSDPEMVKLLLMKGLGLVKEGQVKVVFEDSAQL
jgi:hypothetical protein